MGLYEVPLSCVFVGFWDRNYVSQLPCVRFFSCSTNTSSMPTAFLFHSVAMHFLYSSPVKGNSSE